MEMILLMQVIPFIKDITFDTKISEITSISLEHNLNLINNDTVTGNFIVEGKYKINNISINEETFDEKLDFEITLNDKYDASKIKIEIDNFYYEIINDEVLRVHIDVLLDNLVCVEEERCIEDEAPITLNSSDDEIIDIKDNSDNKIDNVPIKEEVKADSIKNNSNMQIDSFNNVLNTDNNYCTYKVHIIRDNENLDTIKEMYKITKEELEKYNNLEKIVEGTKIIIPIINE